MLQAAFPVVSRAQSLPQTTLSYDAGNRLTTVTSPAGRAKAFSWDRLNRMTGETRPNIAPGTAYGPVSLGYNQQNALTAVTDPRGLSTSYTRNGFGEAYSSVSPDTGGTGFAFDSNGNLLSRITAAGQVESFTYGPTNRIATKTVTQTSGSALTYTFSYGAAGSGVEAGQLVGISAPGQSTAFTHDALGRTTSTTLTLGSQSWTTAYGYASGNLASVTYPSGRVISYTRDAVGRIASVTSSQAGVATPLLSNITYVPFGAVQGWEFGAAGSGRSVQRSYDLNGRLTSVTMPSGSRQYTYDEDDRIVGVQDAVLGTAVYGYDDLSRLTSASTALGAWSYAYDANGNRTSLTSGGTAYTVTVETSSNRTTALAGPVAQAITFTADGQTASVTGGSSASSCTGPFTLGYTADGQLTTSSVMSVVNSVDGRRLQKNAAACAGGATTTFIHDEAGRLIATYDGSGALIEEIVWLGNLPVAVFKSSTPTTPYWVYADNLGSPRAITTSSGQLAWRWDGESFGNTPANENPSGLGSFSFNLRFPGQYFDAETGYHHNGWREYDPAQGRYVQADPIGLAGGLALYLYANASPLTQSDEYGAIPLPLITGAVGGAVGVVASITMQLTLDAPAQPSSLRDKWARLSWKKALVSGAAGAATGALMPWLGTSVLGASLLGAVGNGGQTVATAAVQCEPVDAYDLMNSMVIGGIGGGLSPMKLWSPNPKIAALLQPRASAVNARAQLSSGSILPGASIGLATNAPSTLRCLNTGKKQDGSPC